MDLFRVTDAVAFCDQPTFAELRWLRERGYRRLINLRLDKEQPEDERPKAERAGLEYVAIPLGQQDWSREHFERLDAALRHSDRLPAVIHAGGGARAGIMALTWAAARMGWSESELERRASALGLPSIPAAAREWLRTRSPAAYA